MSRIVELKLDNETIGTRSAEIEVERHRAISDLLEENSFVVKDCDGPYKLRLALQGDRLVMDVNCTSSGKHEEIPLPLSSLKPLIRDYVMICESFYKTAREGEAHRLEAIDMGRRGIHNEGAETLAEALENKVTVDKLTARRLFTLLYVLHIRSTTTIS
ncbi:MAG TPA: UPF0262 family protein [Patescibacteria group bacterium]|nr:UPF0262 family protein [Patescibacteria group bacterium]